MSPFENISQESVDEAYADLVNSGLVDYAIMLYQMRNRIETLEEGVVDTMQPKWLDDIEWKRDRGELVLEVHHILTEPLCPEARIYWETSGEKVSLAIGNTIQEAVVMALSRAKEIIMGEKSDG